MPRRRKVLLWLVPAVGLLASGVATWWLAGPRTAHAADAPVRAVGEAKSSTTTTTTAALHSVHINPGPATPTVRAGGPGASGVAAEVACSTCHTTRTPDLATRESGQLTEFHQGLRYAHGQLSCLSCHNATNYDTLRHADGTTIAYPDTIQLCAQCHGTHYRDYLHGSHGGMNGYWDLTAGPRTRNMCTDCHDAHAPAYPRVQPVFPPQDRGARQQRARDHPATSSSAPDPAARISVTYVTEIRAAVQHDVAVEAARAVPADLSETPSPDE